MNTTQQFIAMILKAAVTGQSQPLPEGYSLEEAYEIIKKQGLVTLAYEGAALCGISRKEPIMEEMLRGYYAALWRSERQMAKVNQLFQAFEENKIDYLPFKGCVMKQLYPKPELRVMGDADILIRFEQYETIKPIMVSLGFGLETESDCELIWKCPELYLELHKCLVQPTHKDYYAYFGDGWSRAVKVGEHRYSFLPEDMYVYLFMHFAKHYRSGGIGCRHVLDIWMYRRANPSVDMEYVNRELEKLYLRQFHENSLRMMDAWFNGGTLDEVTEFMTRRIFSGGAWGNAKDYHIFTELAKSKNADDVKNTRLSYVLRMLFPPLELMRKKYPILEKAPVLLPVTWVMRGVTVLLHKRDRIGASVEVAKMVSDDALTAHQEALRFVGLEFHGELAEQNLQKD